MACEYRETSVFFKFPNLIEKWNEMKRKNNESGTTIKSVYYMELIHAERQSPKRFLLHPQAGAGAGADAGTLEKEIAKSKFDFPSRLRFRIIIQQQEHIKSQVGKAPSRLFTTTATPSHRHEYAIQHFRYTSHSEKLLRRQTIHSWADVWQIETNQNCFNFTTPYMVKMRCDFLEILYCARQQLIQAIPPELKIDGTKSYDLSDEKWNAEHCIRVDRDCRTCKFRVPQLMGTGRSKGAEKTHDRQQTREVCVADTQTRGAELTWKCEKVLNQCGDSIDAKSAADSSRCTTCAVLSAIIGVLCFVILCGVSYACYRTRRTRHTLTDTNVQTVEVNYEELNFIRRPPLPPPYENNERYGTIHTQEATHDL